MSESPRTPPGWYPHPTMAETQQYWDGKVWTDHVAPGLPARPPNQPAGRNHEGLVIAGWVTAVFLPLVGFIIGAVLLTRRPGNGVGMMLLAIAAAVFYVHSFSS